VEIFQAYGEERWARRIARAIVRSRPLDSTEDLARLVARVVPGKRGPRSSCYPDLSVAAHRDNQELKNLERGIKAAVLSLDEEGRLCVISYHSLETGWSNSFSRAGCFSQGGSFRVLTRKPIRPSAEEVREIPAPGAPSCA